ncbi:MAG: hypothetical protein ACRD1T_13425, partial [Acidimicrobiia bacterium]
MKVVVSIFSDVPFWTIPPVHVERLRRELPDIDFVNARNEEDFSREIVLADVAFTSLLTSSLFERAERLRWVHSP